MNKLSNIFSHKGNANHNDLLEGYLNPVRMAIKKTNNNKCWGGHGEKELSYTVGRNAAKRNQ
jgi:hypothetical protein